MPRPRHYTGSRQAAEALVRAAPLASRWIERLLAAHEPPLTVAQYLALEAIAEGQIVGAELARRAAVSPAAVSQLLATLEEGGLLARGRLEYDRRRQSLVLTEEGRRTLRSAHITLRDRLAGLLADLPPPEADALARMLERLQASLSGTPPPPRPHRAPPPPRGPKKRQRP
ncbi:MAG: MarR family transcriptional regulator [Actinobacteria bacterium]|nr:MAG: MarR family transcriptional regulator [Actinomycetota bacterium]